MNQLLFDALLVVGGAVAGAILCALWIWKHPKTFQKDATIAQGIASSVEQIQKKV